MSFSWSWSCGALSQVIHRWFSNSKVYSQFELLGIINLYTCQYTPVQQPPNQTSNFQSPQFQAPEFQAPQFQDVPPARPEPPVTLTSGNDPNFPAPPSSRDSYTLPNVTTNIAETSKFKKTFI